MTLTVGNELYTPNLGFVLKGEHISSDKGSRANAERM